MPCKRSCSNTASPALSRFATVWQPHGVRRSIRPWCTGRVHLHTLLVTTVCRPNLAPYGRGPKGRVVIKLTSSNHASMHLATVKVHISSKFCQWSVMTLGLGLGPAGALAPPLSPVGAATLFTGHTTGVCFLRKALIHATRLTVHLGAEALQLSLRFPPDAPKPLSEIAQHGEACEVWAKSAAFAFCVWVHWACG